jgi:hypothetical protein
MVANSTTLALMSRRTPHLAQSVECSKQNALKIHERRSWLTSCLVSISVTWWVEPEEALPTLSNVAPS